MKATEEKNGEERVSLAELTDRSLLRRFRSGAEDAATALYVRYAHRLQTLADAQVSPAMALRVDPEGIVQSVFRTFFRRAAAGQYDVGEREDLWKLLLVIALNKIRTDASHHRAAKRDVGRTQTLESEASQLAKRDPEQFAMSILKMTIEELLSTMPESHRQIVLLRIEGQEVAQISQQVQRAKRSVERILQQFRHRLEEVLA